MFDQRERAQFCRVAPFALDQRQAHAFFPTGRRKLDPPEIGIPLQALDAPFTALPRFRLRRAHHAKPGGAAPHLGGDRQRRARQNGAFQVNAGAFPINDHRPGVLKEFAPIPVNALDPNGNRKE